MTAARYERLQARSNYPRQWTMRLFNPCGSAPGFCCYSSICCYCASYSLRKQALHGDMSRYICCAGACPCSGRFSEQSCPSFCLGMEVMCCFAQSVASTRWMIQDEMRIQNTQCDNCIIGTLIAAQYLACVCNIVACLTDSPEVNDAAQVLDCIADVLWFSICACIQTQHKVELDVRDGKRGGGGGGGLPMQAPAVQQIQMGGGQQAYAVQGVPTGYPQQSMYR